MSITLNIIIVVISFCITLLFDKFILNRASSINHQTKSVVQRNPKKSIIAKETYVGVIILLSVYFTIGILIYVFGFGETINKSIFNAVSIFDPHKSLGFTFSVLLPSTATINFYGSKQAVVYSGFSLFIGTSVLLFAYVLINRYLKKFKYDSMTLLLRKMMMVLIFLIVVSSFLFFSTPKNLSVSLYPYSVKTSLQSLLSLTLPFLVLIGFVSTKWQSSSIVYYFKNTFFLLIFFVTLVLVIRTAFSDMTFSPFILNKSFLLIFLSLGGNVFLSTGAQLGLSTVPNDNFNIIGLLYKDMNFGYLILILALFVLYFVVRDFHRYYKETQSNNKFLFSIRYSFFFSLIASLLAKISLVQIQFLNVVGVSIKPYSFIIVFITLTLLFYLTLTLSAYLTELLDNKGDMKQ